MGFLGVVGLLTPAIVGCILMFILWVRASKLNSSAFDLIPIVVVGFHFGLVGAFSIFPALDDPNESQLFFLVCYFVLSVLGMVYMKMMHIRKERDAKKARHDDADHQHKLAILREMVAEYEEKHQMLKQERDKKD